MSLDLSIKSHVTLTRDRNRCESLCKFGTKMIGDSAKSLGFVNMNSLFCFRHWMSERQNEHLAFTLFHWAPYLIDMHRIQTIAHRHPILSARVADLIFKTTTRANLFTWHYEETAIDYYTGYRHGRTVVKKKSKIFSRHIERKKNWLGWLFSHYNIAASRPTKISTTRDPKV